VLGKGYVIALAVSPLDRVDETCPNIRWGKGANKRKENSINVPYCHRTNNSQSKAIRVPVIGPTIDGCDEGNVVDSDPPELRQAAISLVSPGTYMRVSMSNSQSTEA